MSACTKKLLAMALFCAINTAPVLATTYEGDMEKDADFILKFGNDGGQSVITTGSLNMNNYSITPSTATGYGYGFLTKSGQATDFTLTNIGKYTKGDIIPTVNRYVQAKVFDGNLTKAIYLALEHNGATGFTKDQGAFFGFLNGYNTATKVSLTINNSVIHNNGYTGTTSGAKYGGAINIKSNLDTSLAPQNPDMTDPEVAAKVNAAIEDARSRSVNINNSWFDENKLQSKGTINGGAINTELNRGEVNVANSFFTNNSVVAATGSTSTYVYGGAVSNASARLNISNTYFGSNKAEGYSVRGGAVYDGEFADKTFPGVEECFETHKFENVIFENNTAKATGTYGSGGALYEANSSTIDGGLFKGNSVKADLATPSTRENSSSGGAVYQSANGSTQTVKNTTFEFNNVTLNNAASANGGALYQAGEGVTTTTNNTTFRGNYISSENGTNARGGALYQSGGNFSTTIENSTFENNYIQNNSDLSKSGTAAISEGGAIFFGGTSSTSVPSTSELNLKNVQFNSNAINGNGAVQGGAISMRDHTGYSFSTFANIDNSTFSKNTISSTATNEKASGNNGAQGGAIYNGANTVLNIKNSNFEGNNLTTASNDVQTMPDNKTTASIYGGGAIYNQQSSVIVTEDTSFKNNTVNGPTASGGAIFNNAGLVNIIARNKDVVFEGNTANGNSNAIYDVKGTINLNAAEDKKIIFNDSIASADKYERFGNLYQTKLNINEQGKWNNDGATYPPSSNDASDRTPTNAPTGGTVVLNADMGGFKGIVKMYNGTLEVGQNGTLFNSDTEFQVKGASTVALDNGILGEYDFGKLTLNDNLKVKIDADLEAKRADKLIASGGASATGGSKIILSEINLLTNTDKESSTATVADDSLKSLIELSTNPDVYLNNKDKNYLLTYDNQTGVLSFTQDGPVKVNLNTITKAIESDRFYNMEENENVVANLGQLGGDNSTLTVRGNNNSIIASNKEGFIVKEGQTLNLNNLKEVKGFSSADGGVIKNEGTVNIVDSSFVENETSLKGGAINNTGVLNITAKESNVVFDKNIQNAASNAIHTEGGEVNLRAEKRDIVLNDTITSDTVAALNINKPLDGQTGTDIEAKGDVLLNADMTGFKGDVNFYGGKMSLGENGIFFSEAKKFDVKENSNGTVNFTDGNTKEYNLGNITLNDNLKVAIDTNLEDKQSDRFTANTVNNPNANKIIISEINVLKDSDEDVIITNVADNTLKDIIELSTNPDVDIVGAKNNYYLAYSKTKGELSYWANQNLNFALSKEDDNRVYGLQKTENITTALGIMAGDNTTASINGNNNAIIANNVSGATINAGQTLNINNVSEVKGFASANGGVFNNSGDLNIVDTSFRNNSANNEGGAILNNGNLAIKADKKEVVFENNTDSTGQNAIVNNGTLTLEALNSNIRFNDTIKGSGVDSSSINIKAGNGTVAFNNTVSDTTVNQNGSVLKLTKEDIFNDTVNYVFNGGALSLQNGVTHNTNLGNLTLNKNMNLKLDANFKTQEIDTITANSFNPNGNKINITDIIVLEPTTEESFSMSPVGTNMADDTKEAIIGAIQYTGGDIVYSPIYKYGAEYDPTDANLHFSMLAKEADKPTYNDLNPGIMASSVAAQLGGYAVQTNSYYEAFDNMDSYMLMTKKERQAAKFKNRYATNSDMLYDSSILRNESASGWFKPYTTFERVNLHRGPKVSNTMYGSFFGTDSELKELSHGFDGMWNFYMGYNGSHQAYNGVGIYQNGGTLGASGMLFKGNFFTGLTANVGASAARASSVFGSEDFAMLMSGVASKTGYNMEFKEGKFIIQPSYLMSYSFVNTFDYKNPSGVKINSDPLHAIQIEPGIKFIFNLKNGWQPYMGVSMIWNIIDKTRFMANDVSLPELSINPYVRYGAGLRKAWGETATGYFQTYVTNGGRNGVGLQAGCNITLGKNKGKKSNNP